MPVSKILGDNKCDVPECYERLISITNTIRRAHKMPAITALQVEYDLMSCETGPVELIGQSRR